MEKIASKSPESKSLGLASLDLEKPRKDKEGRFSLNDLHRLSGAGPMQEPKRWVELDTTRAIIEVLQYQQKQKAGKSVLLEVIVSKRGKSGGTWGTLDLALAYCNYLSPEFHAQALNVLVERIEEQADPELGIQRARARAINAWKVRGRSADWIAARLAGVDTRNQFTAACSARGVKDYRLVTNGVYTGLFGKTARELREQKSLPDGANIRDAMDETELISTRLVENLTIRKAQDQKLWGDGEMADAANHVGRSVQSAVRGALGTTA